MSEENTEEIWKDVAGYEGYYRVSNLGRVRSLDMQVSYFRKNVEIKYFKSGRILTLSKCKNGYLYVKLSKNKTKSKTFPVHRIVAESFIGNTYNKPTVNHINEIKTDNRVLNLEWSTYKEQVNCGTVKERMSISASKRIGEKSSKYKPKNHYSTKCTTRSDFKNICKKYGWIFSEFKEVWKGCYRKNKREKMYYYTI